MDGTVTLRHDTPDHRYELHLRPPDPRLRGLVTGVQGFEERTAAPMTRREVANGQAVLILDLAGGWTIDGRRVGSFAGGLSDVPTLVGHDGAAECLQVDLTPAGVRALLGVPAGELANAVVGLDDLLGARARRLIERLAGAPTWAGRFAVLDATLLAAAAEAPPPRPDVQRALRRLRETGGALPVEALARELRCSRRHLARRFAEDVGLTPKAFARVERFGRAAALLRDPAGPSPAEVAARCGYADQPHLTREVRELAGVTPGALRAAVVPGGGGVGADGAPVPSVQDERPLAA